MNRRGRIQAVAALAFAGASCGSATPAPIGRNALIASNDTPRADHLFHNGDVRKTSPRLRETDE